MIATVMMARMFLAVFLQWVASRQKCLSLLAAFDQMPFLLDVLSSGSFCARDGFGGMWAEVIGIQSGIAQYPFGRPAVDRPLLG